MSLHEAPTLLELARLTRGLSREQFRSRYPFPFLIRMNDGDGGGDSRKTAAPGTPARFHTVIMGGGAPSASATPNAALCAHELKKRPGSNAFLQMVTIGRAANNDIVIQHPRISKFHASLARAVTGEWTITDASSNGTWVDTERLQPRKARSLARGAAINLAGSVHLCFLSADAMFDELERIGRRLTAERVAS